VPSNYGAIPVSHYRRGGESRGEWIRIRSEMTLEQAAAALADPTPPKDAPTLEGIDETDPEDLAARAADLVYDAIADVAGLAERAAEYAKAVDACRDSERSARECFESERRTAGDSFVAASPTLLHYVVRESVVAALSHNPALVSAFCERGPWFPEFMDHVCDVSDWIRARLGPKGGGTLPTEDELAEHAEEARRKKWGDHVFRLYKHREPTRFAKTLSQVESSLRRLGVYAGGGCPEDEASEKKRLMWEYLIAEHAAHGDCPHDHRRDLETLWRFGMRDHGLSVLAKMHRAYVAFGGSNELTKIAEGLSSAEFELASVYYELLSRASAIRTRPMRSRSWSESSLAALCAKHCVPDGAAVPEQLTLLYVCDSCKSIVTQMTPRTSRPSTMSSCFGTASDSSGRNVCADRRNLSRKRATAAAVLSSGAQPAPPPPLSAWTIPCQETRTRTVSAIGSMIEFETKFSSMSERSSVSRLPCILTPCCGQFTRYLPEDACDRGYECLACSTSRGASRTLVPSCAACGRPLSSHPGGDPDGSGDPRMPSCAPAQSEEARAQFQRRYDALFNAGHPPPEKSVRVGDRMPVSSAAPGTALAFDDMVSFAVIPVDLCGECKWHPQVRRGEWPVMLSSILEFARKRKADDEHRTLFNGGGFYSHADPNFSKKKHKPK
jgi:hypothetical protein